MTSNKLGEVEDAVLTALNYCVDALDSLERQDVETASDLISRAVRELEYALQQLRQLKG